MKVARSINTVYRSQLRSPYAVGGVVIFLLLVTSVASLMFGQPILNPAKLFRLTFGGTGIDRIIVLQGRLPRLVLAILAGGLLATSGLLVQDTMRNSFAGPELLGVSSGAAVVMAGVIVLNAPIPPVWQPWYALAGGVLGGGTVLGLSRWSASPQQLVLIGASVSCLLSGAITAIISFGKASTVSLLYQYLVGQLVNRTWTHVLMVLPWCLLLPVSWLYSHKLNLLKLDDESAIGLGVRISRLRLLFLAISICVVAPVVATCGPISYVSLFAPHISRRILGTGDSRRVLPCSILIGSALLAIADLIGEVIFSPLEMPAGVFTVLIGGPVILLLLLRDRSGRSL
jgi:iron complex transport system permease protein